MIEKIKERALEQRKIEKGIENGMANIVLFPGSVEEYEKFKRYEVEIIDTKSPDKSFFPFDYHYSELSIYEYLLDQGLEAIVNLRYKGTPAAGESLGGSSPYGLPVRKARNS